MHIGIVWDNTPIMFFFLLSDSIYETKYYVFHVLNS